MSSSRREEGNLLLIVEAANILEGKRTSNNEHGKKKPYCWNMQDIHITEWLITQCHNKTALMEQYLA